MDGQVEGKSVETDLVGAKQNMPMSAVCALVKMEA
jgi:hypothetical protein